jgi:hypothetical protein
MSFQALESAENIQFSHLNFERTGLPNAIVFSSHSLQPAAITGDPMAASSWQGLSVSMK